MAREIETGGRHCKQVRIKSVLSVVSSIIAEKKNEVIFYKDVKQNNHNIYFQHMEFQLLLH